MSGCATFKESPEKDTTSFDTFVRFSLTNEVIIEGNTVCHRDEKSPSRECESRVKHPQRSHLMLTLDDGKYQLIPGGRWVDYYHNNLKVEHQFTVSTLEGTPIGHCAVKLDRMTPTRVYIEECVYNGVTASVVTKIDTSGRKVISMVGSLRTKEGGVNKFVAQ
jgi:hypothetical protein